MCGLLLVLLTGPRTLIVLWALIQPRRWENAFDTAVWPILGFLFFPWTTLMFVIVAPGGSVEGSDWLWLALAFIVDWFSTVGAMLRRGRMPGYAR